MNWRVHLIAFWLICSCSLGVKAEIVADLYASRVPVADQSRPELDSAARDALAEVLVKASGSSEVLGNPSLSDALGKAPEYVQQYVYTRADNGELFARFEFDSSVVTRLLRESGAPLWTANRPPVLVWLVFEGELGRQFVNAGTDPELAAEVTDAFSQRGVPVLTN